MVLRLLMAKAQESSTRQRIVTTARASRARENSKPRLSLERRSQMTTKRTIGFLASALLTALVAIPAMAQPQPGGAPGGGPGGGRFDPAQIRQRMMDRIKETLCSSDDEFKVLEPKIDQVMT